jgi:sulfide:quinone oxidoreductase
LHDGSAFRQCGIDRVEIGDNTVHLADGSTLLYDVLVVATGAVLVPEETVASPGVASPTARSQHQPSRRRIGRQ